MQAAISTIINRARLIEESQQFGETVEQMLQARLDEWLRQTRLPARQITYSTRRGTLIPLLKNTEERQGRWEVFTCLNSMRDVEAPLRLILDDHKTDDGR